MSRFVIVFLFIVIIPPISLHTHSPDAYRYKSLYFPITQPRGFSNASCSLWKWSRKSFVHMCVCVTWDICGRRLISLRLTACGSRLLSNWQSSTPSLRAWARSHTWHNAHKIRLRNRDRMDIHVQVCGFVCDTAVLPVRHPMLPGGYQEELDSRSTTTHTAATTPSLFSEQCIER